METSTACVICFLISFALCVNETGTISFKKNKDGIAKNVKETVKDITGGETRTNSSQEDEETAADITTGRNETNITQEFEDKKGDDQNSKKSNTGLTDTIKGVNDLVGSRKDVLGSSSTKDLGSIEFFTTAILGEIRGLETAVRPVKDINEPLDLYINVKIISLTAFDEIRGEVSLVTSMQLMWDASNTPKWNPVTSMRGKLSVTIPGDMIWRPKLLLLNPAKDIRDLTQHSDNLRIMHNGTVEWNIISSIEASCSVDISLFPFDTQICTIDIATWGYTESEINIIGSFEKADNTFFRENSVWELLELHLETGNQKEIAFITIALQFKRHWQYFMINILLAPVLLNFLSPCVFLLPANSGERISFAITCFLAFGVFSSLLAENIPRSSSPVARLCFVLMNMTLQSFGVAFCTILSLRMYSASNDANVPLWMKIIVKLFSPRSYWMEKESYCSFDEASSDGDSRRMSIKSITMMNKECKKEERLACESSNEKGIDEELGKPPSPQSETDQRDITWNDIARIMDYVFYVIFTGCMFITLLVASYNLLL